MQSDFLLWTVRSPGVEYAISDIGGVQDRGAVGQVLSLEDDYTGGIRLGLGKRVGACAYVFSLF